ncbi:MAG: 3-deoxy-7-phosphoheptulonate synthase [Fibrobacteres bacterium]|nr:3-deoxy-7-phosphoheptulonate synthase [Fibrobacterota bacterium]
MSKVIQNVNISRVVPLISPAKLNSELVVPSKTSDMIYSSRYTIQQILNGKDDRMLAIVGPCSIHDVKAAMEYAKKLNALRKKLAKKMFIVMRVYFSKPRTTIGWKGLIADPYLDGSADIFQGIRIARKLLLDINNMGLPTATEMLDPILPQYIAGMISWAAIGARTTESQTHREMASGLSMPVGFKNGTDGNLQIALDAMESSRHPHSFLGINSNGQTAVVRTKGNRDVHLILRGGSDGPNYASAHVEDAEKRLKENGLTPAMIIDCSHANSGKKHTAQETVLSNIVKQRTSGRKSIVGFMLESNLFPGSQKIPVDISELKYGVSITDECMGWDKTTEILTKAAKAL